MRGLISVWLTVIACVSASGLPDPAAFYPLRRPFNTSDASCHDNPAVTAKGVRLVDSFSGGPADTVYEFYGTHRSHIQIKRLENFAGEGGHSFTFLVWINHTGTAGPIISYISDDLQLGCGLWIAKPGKLEAKCVGRDGHLKSLSTKYDLQASWHYVGLSHEHESGKLTLWINGLAVRSKIVKPGVVAQDAMCMGACQGDGRYFRGQMSCLQIYNKALSKHEVATARRRCDPNTQSEMPDCGTHSIPMSGIHGCGNHMTNLSGSFMSPGYPRGYHSALDCHWTIEVPTHYYLRIRLRFKEFDVPETLDACENRVIIYDGLTTWSRKVKQYCQPFDGPQEWLNSSQNTLKVAFHCGKHGTGGGFFAQYQALSIVEDAGMDFSQHYTGVVIGVACAALFTVLSIITFNQASRSLRCDQSGRELVPQSDTDDAHPPGDRPPTYTEVVERPELYPPTPVLSRSRAGSLGGSPAPSPCGSPALSRVSRASLASQHLLGRIATPVGIFSPRHSSPASSRPTSVLSQTISPLARHLFTRQVSSVSQASSYHAEAPADEEQPPPYSADLASLSQCSMPAGAEDPPSYSALVDLGLVDDVTLPSTRASTDELSRGQTSSRGSLSTNGDGLPRLSGSRESIPMNADRFAGGQPSSRESAPTNGDSLPRLPGSRESIPMNADRPDRVQASSRESVPTNVDEHRRVCTSSRDSIPMNVDEHRRVCTSSRDSTPMNVDEHRRVCTSSRESVPTTTCDSVLASRRAEEPRGTPPISGIRQEQVAHADPGPAPETERGVADSVWTLRSDARQQNRTHAPTGNSRDSAERPFRISQRGDTRTGNVQRPTHSVATADESPWTLRQTAQRGDAPRSHAVRAHVRNETMTPTYVTSTGRVGSGAVIAHSKHSGSNLGGRQNAPAGLARSLLQGEESIV